VSCIGAFHLETFLTGKEDAASDCSHLLSLFFMRIRGVDFFVAIAIGRTR